MALIMNQKDMDRILNAILPEGESYLAKVWATITGNVASVLAFGSLSNTTCYVGVTEKSIVIAKLDFLDMGKADSTCVISYTSLVKLKTGHGLVPKQKSVQLKTSDGTKLKMMVNGYAIGSKMDDQAGQTDKLIQELNLHAC